MRIIGRVFFGRNYLGGFKNYFYIEGIDCLSRFWFLSRFCLKAEGRRRKKISILRSASASISHLKSEFLQ